MKLLFLLAALSGPVADIRDGDTFIVVNTPIRLDGVDAPERGTEAGKAASYAIRRIIGGQRLRCRPTGKRSYDRTVAVCYLPNGTDVGEELIRRGFALDCPRYSKGRYRAVEPENARYRLKQARYCQR